MKKVLLFGSYSYSLVNFRIGLIRKIYNKKNYEIILVSGEDEKTNQTLKILNDEIGEITYHRISLSRSDLSVITNLKSLYQLILIFLKERPDIVISYTAKPNILSGFLSFVFLRADFHSMITGLGYVFTDGYNSRKFISFIAKIIYKFSLLRSKSVIFQNPDDKKFFLKKKLVYSKDKCFVIPGSGVDLNKFMFIKTPTEHKFLMMARLLKDKGLMEYMKAAQITKNIYPDVEFLLAGGFDFSNKSSIDKSDLEKYIDDGSISYLGAIDEPIEAIKECRYFVLPSYREGLSRSIIEAMSVGRLIITSDAPGCKDLVINNINGFHVKTKSVDSLFRTFEKVIELSNEAVQIMGQNSRKLAEEYYDEKKVNNQIMSIIERVI